MKRNTLITIAQQVDVSVATVSRALNGCPGVSDNKRRQIQKVAAELSYHPHVFAQDLQRQEVNTVGYVIDCRDNQFTDLFCIEDLILHIARQCAYDDINLLVYPLLPENHGLTQIVSAFHSQRIHSLIITTIYQNDSLVNYLHEHNVHFVSFGNENSQYQYPYVEIDEAKGFYTATKHLIEQGHYQIAFLGIPSTYYNAVHRYNGYLQALEQDNISQNPDYAISNLTNTTEVCDAMEYLLAQSKVPTAFVAASDVVAIYAMQVAQHHGLSAGRDYAIVGFGDTHLAPHTVPPLTSLRQPLDQVGKYIINLAMQLPDERLKVQPIVLDLELVIRQSSSLDRQT